MRVKTIKLQFFQQCAVVVRVKGFLKIFNRRSTPGVHIRPLSIFKYKLLVGSSKAVKVECISLKLCKNLPANYCELGIRKVN